MIVAGVALNRDWWSLRHPPPPRRRSAPSSLPSPAQRTAGSNLSYTFNLSQFGETHAQAPAVRAAVDEGLAVTRWRPGGGQRCKVR